MHTACAIIKLPKVFPFVIFLFIARVKISNADVIEADIAAANGVIHVINNLISVIITYFYFIIREKNIYKAVFSFLKI